MHAPSAGVYRLLYAGTVSYLTISAMVTDMRRSPSSIPGDKETWPAVMVHRFGAAGRRHGDLQYADQLVLEDYFVAFGRGLHGVVAVGKAGFILCEGVVMPREEGNGE